MNRIGLILVAFFVGVSAVWADSFEAGFVNPPYQNRPETWFHLIGGNVSKEGLKVDLEAVSNAGFSGIQLFHGRGGVWPGVQPQITCLGPAWDGMINYAADQTSRLNLKFTMQNCPGWAMSGGPWITPDKAMRHLITSRRDIVGGQEVSVQLDRPRPSGESWRDYKDVAVLAFPTPQGDTGHPLVPVKINSNQKGLKWADLINGKKKTKVNIPVSSEAPVWVELAFAEPVYLRSIELPPVEHLVKRRVFDPKTSIRVQAFVGGMFIDVNSRSVPRGSWQDRLPEFPLVLAFSDQKASRFRVVFGNKTPLELSSMRFFSAARVNNWQGQAGYALRSLDRSVTLVQDVQSWVKTDSIVDISDKMDSEGRLTWDVPKGDWTIVRFGHVNTGVKNKPAPPEATGFECNKFSPVGAEQHFAGYIGRVTAPGGPADKGRLKGMLIDSWECYTQTWTASMEKEFQARRGYELRKWLPALAGWVLDDHLSSERFLRDWRATVSDLLVENYFGRLTELAKDRGLKLSFETAMGDVSPGDILQYYSKADIPMCELWQPNDPHWGGLEMKPVFPAASAAHIYGKDRLAAEAFTNIGIRWNEHPFMLKRFADVHFAMGINHLVFHTYTHNPDLNVVPGTSFGSRIGTPFLRGQTWWKYMPEFTTYLARCDYMLGQGRPVADVLWYLGDDLDHKPRQDSPFPQGYRFDYLNQDALVNRISVQDGQLVIPEGTRWKVLWLAEKQSRRLTLKTLQTIKRLLENGATVIGNAPKENASLSGGDLANRQFKQLIDQLWGKTRAAYGNRRVGKGRLIWGMELASALARLAIEPDVIGADTVSWCHRREQGKDIYFISAGRYAPLHAAFSFRATGQPEFWNPLAGTNENVAIYHQQNGRTVVPIDLPAAGSVFVVFNDKAASSPVTTLKRNGRTLVDSTVVKKPASDHSEPDYGLTKDADIQPWVDNPLTAYEFVENATKMIAWQDGHYELYKETALVASEQVKGTRVVPLNESWGLSVSAGLDTPAAVKLPQLISWSSLEDPVWKHFSGTAAYSNAFQLDAVDTDRRFMLDLGEVANIAEVAVNGNTVSVLWAAPYRVNITPYVKAGENVIEVKVTNTWHNRLVFDASLPKHKRKTWTYSAPAAGTPLEEAGLLGPVKIHVGKEVDVKESSFIERSK